MTKVKVCGITRLEDAELAIGHGAWALGFNLWPPAKRHKGAALRTYWRGCRNGRMTSRFLSH